MGAGRKLSFNPELALEQMTQVFWQKGYAGTSVDDLCRAVGVPKPSLYSYFGDKEAILVKALKHYGEQSPQRRACGGEGTWTERLKSLMTTTRTPTGCFLVNIVAEFMGVSPAVDEALVELSRLNDHGLAKFFEEARERGEISRKSDPKLLAVQVNTFIKGLAVSRKAGASTRALREQVEFFVSMLEGAVGRA